MSGFSADRGRGVTVESPAGGSLDDSHLVEVWGDTVDERHVKIAVALGVLLAVPSFLGAREVLTTTMDNQDLARTYSMLTGLAACLVSALVSARLFEPKRIVTERQLDPEEQIAAAMELAQLPQGLGTLDSLSEGEQEDMRRLGLYDVFAEAERRMALQAQTATGHVTPGGIP
ncbi:hypothetical protein [Aeromicrobium endophyticum]|uniref:Uncharacterized protein n=1 Tax=Aeromicrobium endophyticum TaxID=2292704 RepID=A0A371PAI0_9ACTN|nr:hypothetical protein [Aeromicrobium endophyticum]REK72953.1 hypothetical protein DX116_05000 [Aeromicrobium endophyticum]